MKSPGDDFYHAYEKTDYPNDWIDYLKYSIVIQEMKEAERWEVKDEVQTKD